MTSPQESSTTPTSLCSYRSHYVNECGHLDRPHYAKGLCHKCYSRARQLERNPDASIRKTPKDRSGNATCHPNKRRYHSDGLCVTCYKRRYLYGSDFVSMLIAQDNKCACCDTSFVSESDACVDHNHKTMEVRGLICDSCNLTIGRIESDKYDLALAYLKAHDG